MPDRLAPELRSTRLCSTRFPCSATPGQEVRKVDSSSRWKNELTKGLRFAGLFAGVSIEGTVLIERREANKAFYGSAIPASEILTGRIPPPERANALYEVIEAAEGIVLHAEPETPASEEFEFDPGHIGEDGWGQGTTTTTTTAPVVAQVPWQPTGMAGGTATPN